MFVFLDIVKGFSCQQCGRCCRNDWLVTVDEEGYRRNRELFFAAGRAEEFNRAFAPLLQDADYGEYASIVKQEDGACWFLSSENLCRLQQTAGHEHLDTVCQWFPRYPMDTARGIELSLSFSCPAAVRLAAREEPLVILREQTSPIAMNAVDFITYVYPAQQLLGSVLRYYFEIEQHLIDLFQARILPLRERLEWVRLTLVQLQKIEDPELMGEAISRLFAANYEQLEAENVKRASRQSLPSEWLLENYFVNYIFRKNLYTHGVAETLTQLDFLGAQFSEMMNFPAEASRELANLEKLIVKLEMELYHNSKDQQPVV